MSNVELTHTIDHHRRTIAMDQSGRSSENEESTVATVPDGSGQNDFTIDQATTTTVIPTKPTSHSESLLQSRTADNGNRPTITTDSAAESSSSSTVRSVTGNASIEISRLINENLIVARYVAFLSVSSLGIYAFTQTPLFFRYRNVADIPSHYFYRRKTITGRLMIRHHQSAHNHPGNNNPLHQNRSMARQTQPMDDATITCYIR